MDPEANFTEEDVRGDGLFINDTSTAQLVAGVSPAENVIGLAEAVRTPGVGDDLLAGAMTSIDIASMALNPVATATGWVTSWIIEHLYPLADILQEVTGDPEEIIAGSLTWKQISARSRERAEAIRAVLAEMGCSTSETAKAACQRFEELASLEEAESDLAAAISEKLEQQGALVALIYQTVRDAISEAIGLFFQSAAEALFSLGTATPLIVAQISSWVGDKLASITRLITRAIEWFAQLSATTARIVAVMSQVADAVKKFFTLVNTPKAKLDDFLTAKGHSVGNWASNGFAPSQARTGDKILSAIHRHTGVDKLEELEDALPATLKHIPDVPNAPDGAQRIPGDLTRDILDSPGPARMKQIFDDADIDVRRADLRGWYSSLNADQRAVFARRLGPNEARLLLGGKSTAEQLAFLSTVQDSAVRRSLAGYLKLSEAYDRAQFAGNAIDGAFEVSQFGLGYLQATTEGPR